MVSVKPIAERVKEKKSVVIRSKLVTNCIRRWTLHEVPDTWKFLQAVRDNFSSQSAASLGKSLSMTPFHATFPELTWFWVKLIRNTKVCIVIGLVCSKCPSQVTLEDHSVLFPSSTGWKKSEQCNVLRLFFSSYVLC